MIAPTISTPYHTPVLPTDICDGGIKLSTKAKSEPQNPKPPSSHIRALPLAPKRKGRSSFGYLYLRVIAAANISIYIIRYSNTVSCESIW